MTKHLTGQTSKLSQIDLDIHIAVDKLTKEMIVGVNSITREMGWEHKLDHEAKLCLKNHLYPSIERLNRQKYPEIDTKSEEYKVLMEQNALDIDLYNHAKRIFRKQWMKGKNTDGLLITSSKEKFHYGMHS